LTASFGFCTATQCQTRPAVDQQPSSVTETWQCLGSDLVLGISSLLNALLMRIHCTNHLHRRGVCCPAKRNTARESAQQNLTWYIQWEMFVRNCLFIFLALQPTVAVFSQPGSGL
jgi:hypothetical protein